jgi:hypothetical protein
MQQCAVADAQHHRRKWSSATVYTCDKPAECGRCPLAQPASGSGATPSSHARRRSRHATTTVAAAVAATIATTTVAAAVAAATATTTVAAAATATTTAAATAAAATATTAAGATHMLDGSGGCGEAAGADSDSSFHSSDVTSDSASESEAEAPSRSAVEASCGNHAARRVTRWARSAVSSLWAACGSSHLEMAAAVAAFQADPTLQQALPTLRRNAAANIIARAARRWLRGFHTGGTRTIEGQLAVDVAVMACTPSNAAKRPGVSCKAIARQLGMRPQFVTAMGQLETVP